MVETLSKQGTLFERDERGQLIPIEIILETLPDTPRVRLLPLTRGEVLKMRLVAKDPEKVSEQDKDIVLNKCIEPKYTTDEIEFVKPKILTAIVLGVLSLSLDIPQQQLLNMAVRNEGGLGHVVLDELTKKK